MKTETPAIEIGAEIAEILKSWRPNLADSEEDVASAVMHAVGLASHEPGTGEHWAFRCHNHMRKRMSEHMRSM